MATSAQMPNHQLPLTGDVYRVHRRPGSSQLVFNDDYRGLHVFDPWSASDIARVAFPTSYDSSGIIHAWCFRTDGDAALVINAESRAVAWIPLAGEARAAALVYPSSHNPTDIRYLWDDALLLTDASRAFLELEWCDGQPWLAKRRSIDVRLRYQAWRQSLERLPSKCNVLRHEPDQERMLYFDYGTQPGRIGVVSWRDPAEDWAIPTPAAVPRLAAYGHTLFALHEDQVQCWNSRGEMEATYLPPAGYQCFDLDTLLARDGYPAVLAVLCTARDLTAADQLVLYDLKS